MALDVRVQRSTRTRVPVHGGWYKLFLVPASIFTATRLDPDAAARLRELAASRERSVSAELRLAVREWLERQDRPA